MSPKQAMLRKQLLAKIHMHKEYLYYKENNAWQDFLALRFLDIFDGKIKDDINFVPDFKGRLMLKKASSNKQFFYLKALLKQTKMPIFSFYKLCKKTLKKDIYSLQTLSKKDCTIMLVVLEKIAKTK